MPKRASCRPFNPSFPYEFHVVTFSIWYLRNVALLHGLERCGVGREDLSGRADGHGWWGGVEDWEAGKQR